MAHELYFKIPEDREDIMVGLVEAVPTSWNWIDGTLYAPEAQIISGNALEDTGYICEHNRSELPIIVGKRERSGQRLVADFYGIVVEKKDPGFIEFREAGFDATFHFEMARALIVGFLKKGYRGCLCFYKGSVYNNMSRYPAMCGMRFQSQKGVQYWEKTQEEYPTFIKVEWNENYGGEASDVKQIMDACFRYNLVKYQPSKAVL